MTQSHKFERPALETRETEQFVGWRTFQSLRRDSFHAAHSRAEQAIGPLKAKYSIFCYTCE
jgi:hypothetical protein